VEGFVEASECLLARCCLPSARLALAALPADEAAERLVLDWSALLRHQTFYKAVFPAVGVAGEPPWW
jgi:hypothetical protein